MSSKGQFRNLKEYVIYRQEKNRGFRKNSLSFLKITALAGTMHIVKCFKSKNVK